MASTSSAGSDPVVVIGGGLAGMAAAARLAKVGHPVQLFEAADRLGGAWAAYDFEGVQVDRAPSALGFPAPWRDLFRKSGRPLEAELARSGFALGPAAPAHYRFADGSELTLPSDRGEQYETLRAAYGEAAARQWRDLLDELDGVWQAVRPLGLESELRDRRQLKPVRATLRPRRTISWLAAQLDQPHLAAIVASTAYRLGSVPQRTPSWCAVELSVARTFGRWQIQSDRPPEQSGRSSVLVEALASRLALRKVDVQLDRTVTEVLSTDGRVTGVRTHDGAEVAADAVISTIDPWHTDELLPAGARDRAQRRRHRRWQPALAPAVSHRLLPASAGAAAEDAVSETVALTGNGVPTVTYRRPVGTTRTTEDFGTVETVHDYVRATPDRGAGLAWNGFRSWLDRPPVTTSIGGLFTAGPSSPGGNGPSAVVLSGALASYGCHDYLS